MTQSLHDDVVAAVVNYNTAALTLRCVRSLLDAGVGRVLVLDCASARADFELLASRLRPAGERVRVIRSEENLGFARGCNRLIDEALDDPGCERVLLANSDSEVVAAGLDECLRAMREGSHDLMGGRMLKPPSADGTAAIDSLGISMYKSLLASNRMSVGDAYLGPTGGFAVYSRRFLEEVIGLHGHVLEPSFFCYAEDTDLCVRARLLGASVGYVDAVVAHHAGQASNAGSSDDFILYHGIRNSIWMVARSVPSAVIARALPWVVLLHAGIVLRHLLQGRWRTLARLYRDAIAGLPAALRARRVIQRTRRVPPDEFRSHIDRHFYEPAFLRGALRDLVSPRVPAAPGPMAIDAKVAELPSFEADAAVRPWTPASPGRARALAEVGGSGAGLQLDQGLRPAQGEGVPRSLDWIVATSVEREPDLVGFLSTCEAALRDGGVVAVVVADKRSGVDRHRPATSLSAVLEAHVEGCKEPTPGVIAEHFMARGLPLEAQEPAAGLEIPRWSFVPHSFRLLVEDLFELGHTRLREVRFLPPEQGEFVLVLGRHGEGPGIPRLALMREADSELAAPGAARPDPAAKPAATPAREGWFFLFAAALYLALGAMKMRAYALDGRFWAEEGLVFFERMSHLPFLERLSFLNFGHLMLPANAVVALAVEAPFARAPLVTTYLSFILQSIPILMIVALRRELGLERWALLAVLVVVVGLPQSPELWANSINLHFHFALVAAVIALVPAPQGSRRHVFRGLLLLAGLSGVPANFLAPLFLAIAVVSRERERWVQFGIIAATSTLQLGLLLFSASDMGPRGITWDPRLYWLPVVAQQVLSPLFGIEVGDRLADVLRRALTFNVQATLFALACSLPIFAFARAAWTGSVNGARVTFLAIALITILGIAGSIGDKVGLISSAGGGRYFFAGNVLAAVFLFRLASTRRDLLLRAFLVLLFVASAVRAPDYWGGPPWRAELEAARRSGAAHINIWPAPWNMKNPQRPGPAGASPR